MQLFGTYTIKGRNFFGDQIRMKLGIANSYNKTLTAKICWGQEIIVCSNLSFSAYGGENGMSSISSHKHTNMIFGDSGLWYRLNKSMEQIDNFCREQERFCEKLSDKNLSRDEAYSTIVRSARLGVIGKKSILDVADIYDKQAEYPNSEEEYENYYESFKSRTSYSLFNAYTQNNKSRLEKNIVAASLDTLKLTEFFNKEFVLN